MKLKIILILKNKKFKTTKDYKNKIQQKAIKVIKKNKIKKINKIKKKTK